MEYLTSEIIKNIYLPSKDFTLEMKKFIKSIWWRYGFKINDKDANNLIIWTILILKDDKYCWINEKYNALRLIHYWFNNTKVLVKYIDDIIDIYKTTILHKNGNIRRAWSSLIDNLNFITSLHLDDLNIVKEENPDLFLIKESMVELFIYLQDLEKEYEKNNSKKLKKSDKSYPWNYNYAEWTDDQLLKSIRKWLDFLDWWMKIMKHFWYKEKRFTFKNEVYLLKWRYEEDCWWCN